MATTLATINSLVNDRRRDTGSNSIDMTAEGFRAINSTLDIWNQMHEWEWQIEENILNYNAGVSWYSIPSSGTTSIFKCPVDLRYVKPDNSSSEFDMVSASSFDSDTLTTLRFSVATKGQNEYLRVHANGSKIDIDPASALTSNGTWVGATAISNVATDSYESFDQNASVSFDYSGTTGTLTKTLTSGVDLSKYKNRSSIFWNHKSTSYTNWSSMTLKFGTDSSNYYTGSVSTDYLSNTPTANQWNKFKIAWSSLSTVGTPTITNIAYVQLTITYASNPSASMWIENFFAAEDVPLNLEYYTTNMVRSGSTKSQKFGSASTTTDNPLWTGKWDFATEPFVNSVLEIIFWMTGEYDDMTVAVNKIEKIVGNLKAKIPSRRRYPETAIKFDIN